MQTSKIRILILDIDGVLIEPRGYREAIHATLGYFGRLMGIRNLSIDEDNIALFESRGIFSEWDILPLTMSAIMDYIQCQTEKFKLHNDLYKACDQIKSSGIGMPKVDYRKMIDCLAESYAHGTTFSDLALQINNCDALQPIFPYLLHNHLLNQMLANTRHISNPITRIFQELVLGKDAFHRTYGYGSSLEVESYLNKYDRVMLSPTWSKKLLNAWKQNQIKLVVYTARPSSSGISARDGSLQYSPEAEMAMEAMGWDAVPMIGLGEVSLAAEQIGCLAETITKPSPIQALGAILAGVNGASINGMVNAWKIVNQEGKPGIGQNSELEVHIFDDTRTGIEAVSEGVSILQTRGVKASLRAYGITSNKDKAEQLSNAGAMVFGDINEALANCYEAL